MRRLWIPILCVTALPAAGAYADDFSWQLTGGARESDVGPSAAVDTATLSATYYLRPVDDRAGPYALAAFLNRSSRVGVSYNEEKATALVPVIGIGPIPLPPRPPATVVTRASNSSLSGRYVWPTSGWYVGAAVAEADAAHPAPLPTAFSVLGDDVSSRSIAVGKYVGRSTTVELSVEAAETTLTSELPLFCIPGFCSIAPIARLTQTIEADSESIGVSALHVGSLGEFTYSLTGGIMSNETDVTFNIVATPLLPLPPLLPVPPSLPTFSGVPRPGGAALVPVGGAVGPVGGFGAVPGPSSSTQRRERYMIAGELFPMKTLGIRLGYARWDGDESLDESYEVGLTWFFRRNIGARIGLARTKSGLPITTVRDVDVVTLQFIGRL